MYCTNILTADTSGRFSKLVPSAFSRLLGRLGKDPVVIGAGSTLFDEPAGIALAAYSLEYSWKLEWVYVRPRHRRRGVGKTLVGSLKHEAEKSRRGEWLAAYYSSLAPEREMLEKFLSGCGFSSPTPSTLFFQADLAEAVERPWVKGHVDHALVEGRTVPFQDGEIFPWRELRPEEMEFLNANQGKLFSPWFNPLLAQDSGVPPGGLGARRAGEVVGFVVTTRASADILHVWRSFVKKELRGSQLYAILFSSILHIGVREGYQSFMTGVHPENRAVLRLMKNAFARDLKRFREWSELKAEMKIASPAAPTAD